MSGRALLILALLSTIPAAARAQHPAERALARIRSGTLVKVDLVGGEQLEGRLRSVTADSMLLAAPSGEQWVALDQIEELHARGRATKTAAMVGAVTGGVAGGTVLGVTCFMLGADGTIGNEDQWVGCAAVGGIVGGAGGAAIGAGIGSLIPKWHVRYRSRR